MICLLEVSLSILASLHKEVRVQDSIPEALTQRQSRLMPTQGLEPSPLPTHRTSLLHPPTYISSFI